MENTLYQNPGDTFRGLLSNCYALDIEENYTGQYGHQETGETGPALQEIFHQQAFTCGSGDVSYASHAFGYQVEFNGEYTIQPSCWPDLRPEPPVHLYAPVPPVGSAPLPRGVSPCQPDGNMNLYAASSEERFPQPQICYSESHSATPRYLPSPTFSGSSQSTFLTPSELLAELSVREDHHASRLPRGKGRGRICPIPSRSAPGDDSPLDTAEPASFFPLQSNDSTRGDITSHEKKRQYLECLEHYVTFLHNHFRRVGLKPAPLERIARYHGLDSRSIRSLLVHMKKVTQQLKERVLKEEQRFLYLRDALERQQAVVYDVQNKTNVY